MGLLVNKVKISYFRAKEKMNLFLTDNQISYFCLQNEEYAIIRFASIEITLKISNLVQVDQNSNILYFSEDVEDKLHIPSGTILQIKKIGRKKLEVGPLIGIFIDETRFENLRLGKASIDYSLLALCCENLYGMCYFFSISNIDFKSKTVKGIFKKNSMWTPVTLPIPKVIYDQNHELDCRSDCIQLRNNLRIDYIIINSIAKLSKMETMDALSKNPFLIDHIPKTISLNSIQNVKDSLEKFPKVYLKPNSLSKGKGIFCISKNLNSSYTVKYRTESTNHIGSLQTIENLNQLLDKYMNIGQGYIIQEDIKKASFRNCSFDIRILFQKDYSATWIQSGVVARIGAYNSIITSPKSGGTVEELSVVLKEVFNENISDKDGLYDKLIKIGKEICITIESEFGDCVELGLDLAIDEQKKIWIIEVNAKPLNVSLKRLNNSKLVVDFNRHPIEYSIYLTGFRSFIKKQV